MDYEYVDPNVRQNEKLKREFEEMQEYLGAEAAARAAIENLPVTTVEALEKFQQQLKREQVEREQLGRASGSPGAGHPGGAVISWGDTQGRQAHLAHQKRAQQQRAQRLRAQKQVKQKKKKTKKTKNISPTNKEFDFDKLSTLNNAELEAMVHQHRDARSPGGTGGPFNFEGGRRKSKKSRKSRKKNRKRRRRTRRRR